MKSPKVSISLMFLMQEKGFSRFSQWIVSFSSLVRPGKLFRDCLTSCRFSGQLFKFLIVYKKKVYAQSLFIFLCCSRIKMLVAGKRKYNHKQFVKNVKPFKDLENGMSNRDVAAKYGVPRNTLSTWFKNKEKILDSLEKGTNTK